MEEDHKMKNNRKAHQPTSRKRKIKGIDSAGKRRGRIGGGGGGRRDEEEEK